MTAYRTVLTAQARRYLSASVAVNARVAYRVNDAAWGMEAPLYFISDGTGSLVAGIAPGWTSEDRAFTLRLFVGQAFGLRAN